MGSIQMLMVYSKIKLVFTGVILTHYYCIGGSWGPPPF